MERMLREVFFLMVAVILTISILTGCCNFIKQRKLLEKVRIEVWMKKLRDDAGRYNLTFRW